MSLTQSTTLTVAGNKPTNALVKVQPTTQRSTKYSYAGWQLRRRYTITNNAANPISNYPYAIDLGLTNALVSGSKALASGNDLRVTLNGLEVARTLVNWNDATFATLAWVILPDLAVGDSVMYEVIYGNASAGAPPTLAYPDLPAFDVTTPGTNRSTNAKWAYTVTRTSGNAAKGVWWIERGGAAPGYSDTRIPGAWRPDLTLDNGIDDVLQPRWSSYTATLTYWMGRFDAKRARDGTLIGGEVMDADGVMIDVPLGVSSVRCELEFINQEIAGAGTDAVGQLVILGRNSETSDWTAVYSNTGKYATVTTIATATYTPSAAMRQVAFADWPYTGVSIPANATQGRYAQAAWVSVLEVNIASTGLEIATTLAETACYDLSSQLALAGDGTSAGVILSEVRLGNWSQASGAGTPRLMCAINEIALIDGERQIAQIWNSTLTTIVQAIPSGCVAYVDTAIDYQGVSGTRTSASVLELRPMTNPLANPSFDTDATGWTRSTVTSGVTAAAVARSTAQFTTTPASGTVVVSANTAGAGASVLDFSALLALSSMRQVTVAMDVRVTSVNLSVLPSIYFYDAAGTLLSSGSQADWTAAANTWYRRVHAVTAPSNATQYRVGWLTYCRTATATGTVFVDSITVNDNELRYNDPDGGGSITVIAEWTERYA